MEEPKHQKRRGRPSRVDEHGRILLKGQLGGNAPVTDLVSELLAGLGAATQPMQYEAMQRYLRYRYCFKSHQDALSLAAEEPDVPMYFFRQIAAEDGARVLGGEYLLYELGERVKAWLPGLAYPGEPVVEAWRKFGKSPGYVANALTLYKDVRKKKVEAYFRHFIAQAPGDIDSAIVLTCAFTGYGRVGAPGGPDVEQVKHILLRRGLEGVHALTLKTRRPGD